MSETETPICPACEQPRSWHSPEEPCDGDSPRSLMRQFEEGAAGLADIDMVGTLWQIITDVCGSYELAMQYEGINPDTIGNINNTVNDYLSNHYGD